MKHLKKYAGLTMAAFLAFSPVLSIAQENTQELRPALPHICQSVRVNDAHFVHIVNAAAAFAKWSGTPKTREEQQNELDAKVQKHRDRMKNFGWDLSPCKLEMPEIRPVR